MSKTLNTFNVIIYGFNSKKFETYDVLPYLRECYKGIRKKDKRPETFEQFKDFVEKESRYMFWSRCEWEIILSPWPPHDGVEEKWDVYGQIEMNLDLIARLLMEDVVKAPRKKA